MLHSYFTEAQTLENKFNKLVKSTASMSLDPDILSRFIHSTGSAIKSTVSDTSRFFINDTEQVFSMASNLLGGHIQLFVNFFVIVFLSLSVIYIVYQCNSFSIMKSCFRRLFRRRAPVKRILPYYTTITDNVELFTATTPTLSPDQAKIGLFRRALEPLVQKRQQQCEKSVIMACISSRIDIQHP